MAGPGTEQGLTLDRDRVAGVLSAHGLGTLASVAPLDGGQGRSYRVNRVNAPPLVLKAFDDGLPDAGKEAFAAGLLSGIGIPHTRIIAADASGKVVPFGYTLATYLPGWPVIRFRDQADARDLYRQMGAMLRKLHSVRLPLYGPFGPDGIIDGKASHAAYIGDLLAHGLDRFRHYGGSAALAQRLGDIVAQNADVIACSPGAVFAHGDFQPHNVLAVRDPAGRLHLTGLIDYGNARAADPVFDLAKTLFCCDHDAPGSRPAILQGYGPIAHPAPEAALRVYLLLHRLTMWWWLRHTNIIHPDERHGLMSDLEQMASEPSRP